LTTEVLSELIATLMIVGAALIFPFTLLGDLFGFRSPSISFLVVMTIIVVLYITVGDVAKRTFYERVKF
jgi:uncharacterized membrane protein